MQFTHDIGPLPRPDFLRRTIVLIPARDEEDSLGATIKAWRGLGVFQVRVVDNGSVDGTAVVALLAGAETVAESKPGYGAAVWRGLQDWPAQADWVLFSSADGSDRLTLAESWDWHRAIEAGADLVLGDRTAPQSGPCDLNPVQRLGNRFICLALRIGWGTRFRDMGSMRLIRHRVLLSLGLKDRGFGWNVEMQIRALQRGLRLVELPVSYPPRQAGQSKISGHVTGTMRAGWGILRTLGQMWQWRREGGRPYSPPVPPVPSRPKL